MSCAQVIQFSITSDQEDGLDVVVQVRRPAPGKVIRRDLVCSVDDVPMDIQDALRRWLAEAENRTDDTP